MKLLLLLVFSVAVLSAFDIKMIDETQEGIKKAKENSIAKDGKIIYKPISHKIIKPMKKNIIYPIGVSTSIKPSVTLQTSSIKSKKDIENSFTSKDDLTKSNNLKEEEITVDKFFKGLKESNNTKKIIPVNIE